MEGKTLDHDVIVGLAADIVASHVSNNDVAVDDVPRLISNVYAALSGLGDSATPEEVRPDPAVSIRASVKKDHIVCLDFGKKLKMLKRHLMTDHGLTPEGYRERWNLPGEYPLVAPDYSGTRSELAKKIGLGRTPGLKRGRRKKAAN